MNDTDLSAEVDALQQAEAFIVDVYRDATRGGTATPEIRHAIRQAWVAGRNWMRSEMRRPSDS